MMAASYLEEFFETRNEQLLPLFEHHANLSSRWPGTPVEVLLAASDLHWQADRRQTAMELLELASKRSPTASLRLSARANQMGNQRQPQPPVCYREPDERLKSIRKMQYVSN